ncbi:MAG: hypothetical protein Q7S16_05020 [bacterium]|nr:hypothetical protein [bacterium]
MSLYSEKSSEEEPRAEAIDPDIREEKEVREQSPHPEHAVWKLFHRLKDLGVELWRDESAGWEAKEKEAEEAVRQALADAPKTPLTDNLRKYVPIKKGMLSAVAALSLLIMTEFAKASPEMPTPIRTATRAPERDAEREERERRSRITFWLEQQSKEKRDLPVAYGAFKRFFLSFTKQTKSFSDSRFNTMLDVDRQLVRQKEYDLFEEYAKGGFSRFQDGLHEMGRTSSEREKILHLSLFGELFFENYDLEGNAVGAISMEDMVKNMVAEALGKKVVPLGQCRQISVAIGRIATNLGFESFVTSIATQEKAGHTLTGIKTEDGNIVFLDYGIVIPTGTQNLRDAARVAEMLYGASATYNMLYNAEGKARASYVTRAGEDLRSAAGMHPGIELLQYPLLLGENRGRPVDVFINTEKSEVTLQHDGFFLSAVRFDRTKDPLNALLTLQALRFGASNVEASGDSNASGSLATDISVTYFVAQHKDPFLVARRTDQEGLLLNSASSFALRSNITKALSSETITAFQMASQYSMNASHLSNIEVGMGLGERFAYIDPKTPQSFYLEGGVFFDLERLADVQGYGVSAPVLLSSPYAKIGATIPVREAKFSMETILESGYEKESLSVQSEIKFRKWSGTVKWKKGIGIISGGEELREALEKDIRIGGVHGAVTFYGAQEQLPGGKKGLEFSAKFSIIF